MSTVDQNWFTESRFGLFIHYGLFSELGRAEWVWNREQIPRVEYCSIAQRFTATEFDAEALCDLALEAGMRYVVFTTMHHEGFRLYDTALSEFSSVKTPAGRDLVAEVVQAARARGLKVGLYHSLNNWYDRPDAVDALEDPKAKAQFTSATFERIRELVTRFNPIDILWYDGWWPFNAEGWQAQKMNAMVRSIQPRLLVNGRNGLPGDFATPEGHLGAPKPWRPWEACMTLNNSWGYHAGDHDWKSPGQVIDFLATCAQGKGNLLLNIGPRGDGSVPEKTVEILRTVGAWLKRHSEAIFDTDLFTFDLREQGDHKGDWNFHGPITLKGNTMFWLLRRWPGPTVSLGGVKGTLIKASFLDSGRPVEFRQEGERIVFPFLPKDAPHSVCTVLQLVFAQAPALYQCGGLRVPKVTHPHYDPCESDIAH